MHVLEQPLRIYYYVHVTPPPAEITIWPLIMAVNSQVALRVSRFLSYTVIGMSSIMRLPQVFAILQAGNSTGLNVKAY